jgi:putative transposase
MGTNAAPLRYAVMAMGRNGRSGAIMDDDTNNHHRRSIRLRGYDYTQNGVYFVAICTHARAHRFGQVNDGAVELSPAGQLLDRCWQALPRHFSFVTTDAYVIMPDHIHGILAIDRR